MQALTLGQASRAFDSAVKSLSERLRQTLLLAPDWLKEEAQEIRLRAEKPIAVYTGRETYFLTERGKPVKRFQDTLPNLPQQEIVESFHNCCSYSVYSHQNEIRQGFVTVSGGHRIGVCGTAVLEKDEITGIRDLSSLNVRIARQINGAADTLLGRLGGFEAGILIAGPPSSGKTTVLRDLSRQLSIKGKRVVVVDERGELGGSYQGICQNDLGLCDVLTGYPKGAGILQAVRCLSPDIVVFDEAGNEADVRSIEEGLNAGVKVISTIHAGSMGELQRRTQGKRLLISGAFSQVIMLKGRGTPGEISEIYQVGDQDGKTYGLFDSGGGGRGFRVPAGEKAIHENQFF